MNEQQIQNNSQKTIHSNEQSRKPGKVAKTAMGLGMAIGSLFLKGGEESSVSSEQVEQPAVTGEIKPTEGYTPGNAERVSAIQKQASESEPLTPTPYGSEVTDGVISDAIGKHASDTVPPKEDSQLPESK